jgi:CRISPR-associated protein Cmr3
MAATAPWVGLRLDPLNTLFFRDGRPFDAATRVTGGLPFPQTLAGAVRTALLARTGFRFDEFARRRKGADILAALMDQDYGANPAVIAASFRGPWLALAGVVDHLPQNWLADRDRRIACRPGHHAGKQHAEKRDVHG